MQKLPIRPIKIISQREKGRIEKEDLLVTEEPLEIIIGFGPQENREQIQLAITMRTPGHDFDLVTGFLFSEGIIAHSKDILSIKHCENVKSIEENGNVVKVEIQPEIEFSRDDLKRNFFMNSSCGVCGKTSIDSLQDKLNHNFSPIQFQIHPNIIHQLSEKSYAHQTIFTNTGGLHAASFFDKNGELLNIREDIGRHNALDKLIGWQLFQKQILNEKILFLSGRVGFELIQKAVVSQIPIIVAVGAPSSLAVDLAKKYNITLIGFARNNGFNIYSGENRIMDI